MRHKLCVFTRAYAYLGFWYCRQWNIMHEKHSRNSIFVVMENFSWIEKNYQKTNSTRLSDHTVEEAEIKFIPWVIDIFQIDINFGVARFEMGCTLTNPITSIWIFLHFYTFTVMNIVYFNWDFQILGTK